MAALAALAKKVWSARRLLVLLLAPLALLPVVFALPPKVTPLPARAFLPAAGSPPASVPLYLPWERQALPPAASLSPSSHVRRVTF